MKWHIYLLFLLIKITSSCSGEKGSLTNKKQITDSIRHFILDSIRHSQNNNVSYYWQRRSDRELNSEILYEFVCKYYDTEDKKRKLISNFIKYISSTKGVLSHLREHPQPLLDWYFMQNTGIGYDSAATAKWRLEGYSDSTKGTMFIHVNVDTKLLGLAHGISRDSNFIKKVYRDWKKSIFENLSKEKMDSLGIRQLCIKLQKSYIEYRLKKKPERPEMGYPNYEEEWLYSFWYRRHLEGNMETVYEILKEIDEHYEKQK